ncbi:MAG TPA: hypothetical protein VLI06_01170 [Solimonas sp.]|nr:hypothetical protein [Solimonas sp.]
MSADSNVQRLAETLGKPATEFKAFAALAPAQVDLLTEAVHLTQQRQRAALEAAMTDALSHLPALLRGPVKKILGIK